MVVPVFDTCCGCIDLKTGCFILGYLNLLGNIVLTILYILVVIASAWITSLTTAGLLVLIASIIALVITVLAMVFAIVLLVGLHKNIPKNLKAYLIYSLVFLVLYLIQFCISVIALSVVGIIQGVIVILLQIYFLLVVRSMYLKMLQMPQGPANPYPYRPEDLARGPVNKSEASTHYAY